MPLNKPIDLLTEDDLQELKDNEVSEGKTIEYKLKLPNNTHEDKREFLADVSSFANASGGHILYGIKEESGIPVDICGLVIENVDEAKQRLENLLRDCIKPRIPGFSIRGIELSNSRVVIIIRIQRSWNQPHVVEFRGHWRFYSRNSAGKYPLDVSEVRSAFALSESIAEKIRNFRTERLGKIVAGETPVTLEGSAKIVLHIVPMGAFDTPIKYDLSFLKQQIEHLQPIGSSGWTHRYNFDGFLTYDSVNRGILCLSYLQIFRNGIIEAVESYLLNSENSVYKNYIPSSYENYEKILLDVMPRYFSVQKQIGIVPPIFIMLSILNIKGFKIYTDFSKYGNPGKEIDRNDLIIPEIMIEDYDCDPAEVLKPAFDAVWNAAGWERSMNYNKNGEWVGQ